MAKVKLTPLRRKWLKALFGGADQTEAARIAEYKCKNPESFKAIGSENFTLLNDYIVEWLDETGLSEGALKKRLLEGLDVQETKFFPHTTKGGKFKIKAKTVEAISEQRRYLDMAMKARGLFKTDNEQKRDTIIINPDNRVKKGD